MTHDISDDRRIALYNQNSEHFRGLNSQMWQIPIIGMTLTGGLWFGVSNVKDSPVFQVCLLLLAAAGNVALIIVLQRLRFVMGAYLDWINKHEPEGEIDAKGSNLFGRSNVVRTTFQTILGIASLISVVLVWVTASSAYNAPKDGKTDVEKYYDKLAFFLADERQTVSFDDAHPYLMKIIEEKPSQTVLYLGAGGFRDAFALRELGHSVLVGAPSRAMLLVARASAGEGIIVSAAAPEFSGIRGSRRFSLIIVDGLWAHAAPKERQVMMDVLLDKLEPAGQIYMAFRDGPSDAENGIYPASIAEIERLVSGTEAIASELSQKADLAGRSGITWRTVLISKDGSKRMMLEK